MFLLKFFTFEAKELILKADAPTWKEKVRAFGDKDLTYGKNISTAENAIGTIVKSGERLMELGKTIGEVFRF
ncbi:MAG: hypothetical protein COA92_07965 [Sulfurovum sp.]|nr:MAG: hypothetical protein COA92_07965 [Sulfurovum sp.]